MLFEGTEKKFELLVSEAEPSLRGLGRPFWKRVVERAGASIISRISSSKCDAYLLSESSLFVFDHRVVMITCGLTNLVLSLREIMELVPPSSIRSLIYERKNENFPDLQPSDFNEDVLVLNELLPGTAIRFGAPDGHHLSLFHLSKPFEPDDGDVTLEILMYDLAPEVQAMFSRNPETSEEMFLSRTGLETLVPGFTTNDYFFDPVGYSLNGVGGNHYYTVHVTPENPGSYTSIETNYPLGKDDLQELIDRTVALFRPRRFDVVLFQRQVELDVSSGPYQRQSEEVRSLACGYRVQFSHFENREQEDSSSPKSGRRKERPEPAVVASDSRGSS
jgi:S-adenosylmethionine decarboxylase